MTTPWRIGDEHTDRASRTSFSNKERVGGADEPSAVSALEYRTEIEAHRFMPTQWRRLACRRQVGAISGKDVALFVYTNSTFAPPLPWCALLGGDNAARYSCAF